MSAQTKSQRPSDIVEVSDVNTECERYNYSLIGELLVLRVVEIITADFARFYRTMSIDIDCADEESIPCSPF